MNMTLKPASGLSGSTLKVIAMISMVIDHVALYLMEHGTVLYETMRCIGRIAFPVFAFLIAEGFIHTRSRYRYFFTLLGFSMVLGFLWTHGMAGLASWLGVDYEWRGIIVIVIFYLFNVYGHSFPYSRGMQFFSTFALMIHYGVIGAVMACMILYLYNGKRGFVQGSIAKYGFYAFYPAHFILFI